MELVHWTHNFDLHGWSNVYVVDNNNNDDNNIQLYKAWTAM